MNELHEEFFTSFDITANYAPLNPQQKRLKIRRFDKFDDGWVVILKKTKHMQVMFSESMQNTKIDPHVNTVSFIEFFNDVGQVSFLQWYVSKHLRLEILYRILN